jgi:predicted transcriptional regulator
MPKTGRQALGKPNGRLNASRQPAKPPLNLQAPQPAPRWTFLTNHAHVLIVLNHDPSIVLREVARRVGITERAVQKIIVDLEDAGVIEREKVGRQNQYRIHPEKKLRHPIEEHQSVGALLSLICNTK